MFGIVLKKNPVLSTQQELNEPNDIFFKIILHPHIIRWNEIGRIVDEIVRIWIRHFLRNKKIEQMKHMKKIM